MFRQGRSDDWLHDAAKPLRKLAEKADSVPHTGEHAMLRRPAYHLRHGIPVTLDDRAAQLEFGQLIYRFPQTLPPRARRTEAILRAREPFDCTG